jgi:phospholipid transport system substrate-binding protein
MLYIVVSGYVLVSHLAVWAAESPREVIRATVDQAIAVLQDPVLQGANHRQARIDKVRAIVLPRFDTEELARRSLGIHWRDRSPEERQEFIRLFTALIEHSYRSTLDRYTSEVKFFIDYERIENDFAEVNTRVFDPGQDRTFAIDYRLRRTSETWLIYDVVIENVSLVRNYRNQFNRALRRSSFADLLRNLNNKVQELDVAPLS